MGERRRFADGVPARLVLGIMAFFGFLVTQMLRSNLYIAIVAMVDHKQHVNTTVNSTDAQNFTSINGILHSRNTTVESQSKSEHFDWDENTQALILSAFYWTYWLSELPGGLLAQRFGAKRIFGGSVFLAAVLNMALPSASKLNFWAASVIRALQGLVLGVTWPAMHCLSGRWIPTLERSKFMASYHGSAVGTALTYPICGLIIASMGWEAVFYITGCLNLIWCLFWWIFVYDSPEQHPRISVKERTYLQKSSLGTTDKSKLNTPWLPILRSRPFWAVLVASQGLMWGTITLTMQLPAYFDNIHNLNIKMNGFISGLPELSKCLFGFAYSALTDFILKRKILSITLARKIAVATCEYIPGILLLLIGYIGHTDSTIAAVLLVLTSAVGGASSSGSLSNIVDISPNFAGAILGLIKTLSMIPGVLSPIITGYLTNDNQTSHQWTLVFWIAAGVYLFCGTVFLIFGSGEVQPWNSTPSKHQEKAKEELILPATATTKEPCEEESTKM